MKVLFASSEVWSLLKTGGLGDVAYSLPHALKKEGNDVRLVLPAYRNVLEKLEDFSILGWLSISLAGVEYNVRVLEAIHKDFDFPLWLVDCPGLFDRDGNPYVHADGYDWPDNAERFVLFSKAVAMLGMDSLNIGWKPDVVHSNDWQTGMVSAFLEQEEDRPRRVFTIHNMAYGGHFSYEEFNRLQLPHEWWSAEGVEFHGNFSMLKAGMIYADAITTVSPSYADEICTPAFGYGMEGVLHSRRYKLSGILNGIDTEVWNPTNDSLIPYHFTAKQRNPGKQKNKRALLEFYGVEVDQQKLDAPLLGMVSRLVEQKGVDMVLEAIPKILEESEANFVLIGTGHRYFETSLLQLNEQYPDRVFVTIGYDEARAHLLEAGSDFFLMPSRFEPCGLNQMYSLRYGTLPIVHRTGGLADTVIDAGNTLQENSKKSLTADANGFVFDTPNAETLLSTIQRGLALYANKSSWQQLQRNAMRQNFDWTKSAQAYIGVYGDAS